ncbi:MAG TPA: RNA polymerase sigma-70 factor, partial [Porphyromonadaceae bacterium]|nr:RNA polymerase sigma-70 factor [Porphyromonadaceae bacterium]
MKEKDTIYENLFRKVAFQDDEQAFKELFLEFYPALCVFAMRY